MRKYPANLIEEIRARIPCSQVCGARVRLKRSGREWVGLSPFNHEKTPSFFVNDAKGRWFDHSAGKDGDIFAFLMETEGLQFGESVERLAADAGVTIPEEDKNERQRLVRQLTLIEVLKEAQSFFVNSLGTEARAYLKQRGVSAQSVEAFGIGYAPSDRSALKQHLARAGVEPKLAEDAGLLIHGEDIPVSYDRFRNRLMFPIHRRDGKLVGFSGRTLGDDKAKYVNSPETEVFSKGQLLYNAHQARQPAHDGQTLVVMEGYLDVIATVAAGFPAAVCTMGTAITEHHLLGLFSMSDVPTICFDPDKAGARAVIKAIQVAFPLIRPGRSLRFASLPAGLDPDEVIQKRGVETFRKALEAATGLADTFWLSSTAGRSLASVEAQGKLEAEMLDQVKAIPDVQLRKKYADDVRSRIKGLNKFKPIVRANGHSLHSTSPGTFRLSKGLQDSGSFTLREAALITDVARAPLSCDVEALPIAAVSERARGAVGRILDLAGRIGEEGLATLVASLPDVKEAVAVLQSAGVR